MISSHKKSSSTLVMLTIFIIYLASLVIVGIWWPKHYIAYLIPFIFSIICAILYYKGKEWIKNLNDTFLFLSAASTAIANVHSVSGYFIRQEIKHNNFDLFICVVLASLSLLKVFIAGIDTYKNISR